MKKILIFSIFIGGAALFFNCQSSDFEEVIQEKQLFVKKKQTKFIYYKGLKVKKRFLASEEELKIKKNKESLKKLYNKLRKEARKKTKLAGKSTKIDFEIEDETLEEVELPTPEMLVEAAKVVLNQFPYEEIEGYATTFNPNPYSTNYEMIQGDFVGLSNAEIEANAIIIDEYYSDNLDYMVLNEIAVNSQLYSNLGTNKSKLGKNNGELAVGICSMSIAVGYGYGLVLSSISYLFAGTRSESSAASRYPNLNGSDDRRDAYRHMLWNSLLANYYFTISSKSRRLNFAKLITDLRETSPCGTSNAIDTRAMDFHNNYVGRKLWSDNTNYIEIFGFTIGLYLPSTSLLKTLTYNMIERESCYIVKDHDLVQYRYNETEKRDLITQTNINKPVYFKRDIAPVSYIATIELEYYECDDNDGDFIPKRREKSTKAFGIVPDEDGDCFREVMVYTPVYPCYISKDVNFNPY